MQTTTYPLSVKSNKEKFVQNMIAIRKEKGISQLKLSELADVSSGIIGEIELGRRNPTLSTMDRIAQALDTPLYKFFIDGETDYDTNMPKATKKQLIYKLIDEISR